MTEPEHAPISVFFGDDTPWYCATCGDEIKRGDEMIAYYDDGHRVEIHRDCFSAAPSPTEKRCPECDGGWGTYTSGENAGEKVPHCDQFCSLQGAERGGDWKHGDAR